MKFKQFTKMNNEKLPVIGFGCWAIGGTWNNISDDDSIEAIKTAVEVGINFFDTAPIYGMGHSETIVGQAIKEFDRSELFIATKCGLVWDESKNVSNNLSKDSIFKEVKKSLERLQTDYIDLYQCHWPDRNTPIKETMEALNELKKAGKIRYIGISNFTMEMVKEAAKYTELATFQGLYNMFEHNPEKYHNIDLGYKTKDEVLPYCEKNGMAYLPYSPLMQGLLTGSFKESGNFDNNDDRNNNPKLVGEGFTKYYNAMLDMKAFAESINKPLGQIALNWLVNQKTVGPIISGAHKKSHVLENIELISWELTPEMEKQINEILIKHKID